MPNGSYRMVIAIYLISLAIPAFSQEASDRPKATSNQPAQLEQMTVTGDWLGVPTWENVKTYPGARTVVTDTEIHQSGARNLQDALRRVPGVQVQDETGIGILPNIGVRGLSPARSERALVLVDGIPAALAPYTGTGLSLFPVTLQSVQAIDVARGGVAVRYGPNNVGGAINFITKPIPSQLSLGAKESLNIATETGHVLSDAYLRAGGFVTDSLGLQLQFNTLQGEAWREHSETEVYNVLLDADWFISDSAELKGRLQYYKADTELPGALSPEAFREDRTQSQRPFDHFLADTWRGSLIYKQNFANQSEFNWTTFAHTSDREFIFGSPFDPTETTTEVQSSPRDFFVVGTEPRYTFTLPFGGFEQKITLGGRYVREEVDFIVDSRDLATDISDRLRDWRFETDAFAAYVSDTFSFLDGRLKITPGLRYENVNTAFRDRKGGTASSNRSEELLPGLDIGYQWSDHLFLFANAHRSLRPPQVAQVTRGGDVSAEVALNYEAGFRLIPSSTQDATLTLFRFDFDNQVEFDRSALRFRNLGETRHQGIELETHWRPAPGLALQASYTLVDAEQRSGPFKGNELPFVSEHQLALEGNYRVGTFNFNVNGTFRSAAFTDADNTVEEDSSGTVGEIPAFWLWNAQISKAFRGLNGASATVSLALNNIFDRKYFFRGVDVSPVGRVPGPGRTIMLAMNMGL